MTPAESLAIVAVDPAVSNRWIAELRAPHRHYHTLDHIAAMIRLYAGPSREIHAAIWLHDIVYDARAGDNEEASADVATRDLSGSGVDVGEVRRIILDTKRHGGGDATLDLFCDLDLSVLGAQPGVYAAYAEAIRREYAHVPEADWRAGRARVLRGFDTRRIYRTTRFAYREDAAHENLRREIARLQA